MLGLDLFSGAGGMSLGARWAGVNVQLAIELHPAAARTIAKNYPECLAIQGDLRHINGVKNYRSRKEELVIFGGPPCQAFSTSNQRNRGPSNVRNFLFRDFLKFVQAEEPDWVVFENVPGILERGSRPYVIEIEKKLRSFGFRLASEVLDAADFGVPQHRKRFFIVGSRNGSSPDLPTPRRIRFTTVNEAIEGSSCARKRRSGVHASVRPGRDEHLRQEDEGQAYEMLQQSRQRKFEIRGLRV